MLHDELFYSVIENAIETLEGNNECYYWRQVSAMNMFMETILFVEIASAIWNLRFA